MDNPESRDTRDALTIDHYKAHYGLVDFILSTRWRTIAIDLGIYVVFAAELLNGAPSMEKLRSLTLLCPSHMGPGDGESDNSMSTVALSPQTFPALRSISLDLNYCVVVSFELPWTQLTHLAIKNCVDSLNVYLIMLEDCVSLREFHLTIGPGHDQEILSGRQPLPLTTSSQLRVLSIEESPRSLRTLEGFLDRLDLPRLWSLALLDPTKADIVSILNLVDRSQCNLRTIRLETTRNALPSRFRRALHRAMPSLRLIERTRPEYYS